MSKRVWGVTVAAVAAALSFASPASATTVFNSTNGPAAVPASGTSGNASIYGWTTNVSGMPAGQLITDVKVGLLNVTHTSLSDVGAVLVSPGGQAFELFDDTASCSVSSIDLTFDDAASSLVPTTCPVATGTYKPTARIFGPTESYPAPGPLLAYGVPASAGSATLDGTFGGYLANGAWKLYIVDFAAGDSGSVGLWDMAITTGTPDASLTPNPVNDFEFAPRDPVEGAAPSSTFTTTNTGSTPLHIDSASMGGTDPSQFAITEDNCGGKTLAPAGTCTDKVAFDPSSLGSKSAQLDVQIADVGVLHDEVSGTGSLLSSLEDPSFGFGARDAAAGVSPAHAFHYFNDATDVDLHVSSVGLTGANPGDFAISSDFCTGTTVTTGSSCEVDAVFDPTSAGAKTAVLGVTSDAPTPTTNAQLTGQGTATPPPSNPQTPSGPASPATVPPKTKCKKKKSRAATAKKCKKKKR